jgi:hypothetical protein
MKAKQNQVVLPQEVTTQSISQFLGHKVYNLKIVFTPKKVSISCKAYQHNFGAKGKTLSEAVYFLSERIRLDRYFA